MEPLPQQTLFTGAIINTCSRSLARLLRLILIVLIGLKFGAGYETDAYFVAQSVLLTFLSFGDRIVNLTFIPIFVDYMKNKGEEEAWRVANTIFTILGISFLTISGVIFVCAPWIASILAPGFSEKALLTTTILIRILSPIPFLVGISAIPAAIFFSYKSFMAPAITALFYGGGAIALTFLLSDKLGIPSVTIGSVLGVGLQTVLLVGLLKKKMKVFSLSSDIHHPGVKKMGTLTGPRLIVFLLGRINIIIDRIFASGLGVGYVSCLSYAYRLFEFPSAILASVFGRTFVPMISEYGASGAMEGIQRFISRSIRGIAVVAIPIAILLLVVREPLIRIVFQRGAFNVNDTYLTATAFLFYDIGLVALCFNVVFLGVFYALQDALTPLKIGAVNAGLNVILDIIFIKWLGLGGIALATSAIALFNTIVLFILLRRKIGTIDTERIVSSLVKISLAGVIMGFVVWSIPHSTSGALNYQDQILKLGNISIIAFITYAIACMLLRVEEFKGAITFFRKRFSF